ncbi:MAG: LysR substrate-binding domain-containing protein [Gammaproteobacteria bacterium]|nr:LysR substrate-binding domain-containing protein [Gammaproteobacteria bacterium]
MLQGDNPLRKPADLVPHTLLHADDDWRTWLLAAGVESVDPARGPIYTDSGMVIQAAIAGHGVAVARSVLAADDLEAGRLVRPFELSLPSEYAYYFVCPAAQAGRSKVVAFRDWLVAEARGEVGVVLDGHVIARSIPPETGRS